MNTRTVTFRAHGYAVIPGLIDDDELAHARALCSSLIERYRSGEPATLSAGVNIGDVSRQHPQRNPGIGPDSCNHEPFIIGDLLALEPRLARVFSLQSIWNCVARLLDCSPQDVLFHFSNLTRKPGGIGPAMGWHRDAGNRFFASDDGRTLRLLIALDPMSARNGGTAVVPGSHLHDDTATDTALCPDLAAGACLALHSATLHGGSPNRSEQSRDVLVIQFGVRFSTLRCQADEAMALSCRERLLDFYRNTGGRTPV